MTKLSPVASIHRTPATGRSALGMRASAMAAVVTRSRRGLQGVRVPGQGRTLDSPWRRSDSPAGVSRLRSRDIGIRISGFGSWTCFHRINTLKPCPHSRIRPLTFRKDVAPHSPACRAGPSGCSLRAMRHRTSPRNRGHVHTASCACGAVRDHARRPAHRRALVLLRRLPGGGRASSRPCPARPGFANPAAAHRRCCSRNRR